MAPRPSPQHSRHPGTLSVWPSVPPQDGGHEGSDLAACSLLSEQLGFRGLNPQGISTEQAIGTSEPRACDKGDPAGLNLVPDSEQCCFCTRTRGTTTPPSESRHRSWGPQTQLSRGVSPGAGTATGRRTRGQRRAGRTRLFCTGATGATALVFRTHAL